MARPPGTPVFDLEECMRIAEIVAKCGGNAKVETVATSIGMSKNGGGFIAKAASARAFNIIDGVKDIKLTDIGKTIIHPLTIDEKRKALKDAFLAPTIFSDIFTRLQHSEKFKDREFVQTLLIREYHIPAKRAVHVARAFVKSGEFAGVFDNQNVGAPATLNAPDLKGSMEPESVADVSIRKGGYFVKITTPFDKLDFSIDNEEDWTVVEASIAAFRRKWEKSKEEMK